MSGQLVKLVMLLGMLMLVTLLGQALEVMFWFSLGLLLFRNLVLRGRLMGLLLLRNLVLRGGLMRLLEQLWILKPRVMLLLSR